MNILIDTNILTRSAEPGHPHYLSCRMAVATLRLQGHLPCVVPQNLYEFWVVSTRPVSVNGMGKTVPETVAELTGIKTLFRFFADTPAIYAAWEQIVSAAGVTGKSAHDARFVAAMQIHGITHLLTLNDADFRKYPNITILTPTGVLAAATQPPPTP